jgi:hypothetical protein
MSKILNICIGHKPFPQAYVHYFDYMLSPFPIASEGRVKVVSHYLFGDNGPSLSEYAQLFWVLANLDHLLNGETHIRTFHYRRFVSDGQTGLGEACSLPYAKMVTENQMALFSHDFERSGGSEMVNTPFKFPESILGQYASVCHLEDLLDFARFLIKENILSASDAAQFLLGNVLIPGSSIGVFSVENFRRIFSVLFKASTFIKEPSYIARAGYQRRNMGFMLERLNSYLLIKGINEGSIEPKTGIHMIVSDSPVIGVAGDIFATEGGKV